MTTVQAIVLGVVQGLTEFLPISSTAHLRITPPILGWEDAGGVAFDTVIQMGTLVAVMWYFRHDIGLLLAGLGGDIRQRKFCSNPHSRLAWLIVAGTVPVVILGFTLKKYIEGELRNLYVIAYAAAGFAFLLGIAELVAHRRMAAGNPGKLESEITLRDVMTVGLFQCCALIPGASRSGSTITGGLFTGLSRATAARFSFLLSLPAVFGAGILQLVKHRKELFASQDQTVNLIVATAVSGIVGYFAISWLIHFLKRYSTTVFIVYRFLLAFVLIILLQRGAIPENEKEEAPEAGTAQAK